MYCIKCGSRIGEDSKFCPFCGAVQDEVPVRETQPPRFERQTEDYGPEDEGDDYYENPSPRSSGSKSLAIIIISIFAIAAAAAVVVFVVLRGNSSAELKSETAEASEAAEEDGSAFEKIKDIFNIEKQEEDDSYLDQDTDRPGRDEIATPQAAEERAEAPEDDSAGEEQSAQEETYIPALPHQTGAEAPGEEEVPDVSNVPVKTPSPKPENTPTPTLVPENTRPPLIEASVKKASKASLSGYKKVTVASAAATSELRQDDSPDIDNSAKSAVDGNVVTSWQEAVAGYGIGEYLDLYLDARYDIRAITFNMGNWRDDQLYRDNSRPKDITIWLDDTGFDVTIPDGKEQYCVEFSTAVPSSEIKVVINSVYAGAQYQDTCISEITFYAEG